MRVCFAPHHFERLKQAGLVDRVFAMKDAGKVSTDELAEHPGRHLMSTRSGFGLTKVFDKISAEKVELVWSQWPGQLVRLHGDWLYGPASNQLIEGHGHRRRSGERPREVSF